MLFESLIRSPLKTGWVSVGVGECPVEQAIAFYTHDEDTEPRYCILGLRAEGIAVFLSRGIRLTQVETEQNTLIFDSAEEADAFVAVLAKHLLTNNNDKE